MRWSPPVRNYVVHRASTLILLNILFSKLLYPYLRIRTGIAHHLAMAEDIAEQIVKYCITLHCICTFISTFIHFTGVRRPRASRLGASNDGVF